MRRAAAMGALATVVAMGCAFVGCRGVLGIEPLELVDASSDVASTNPDVTAPPPHDGGPPDSQPPPPPQGDAGTCREAGPTCPPCCHATDGQGLHELLVQAIQAGCVCADAGSTDCTTQCGSNICSGGPQMPSSDCNMCLDQRLSSPACQQAQCASPACADGLACLRSCFGP